MNDVNDIFSPVLYGFSLKFGLFWIFHVLTVLCNLVSVILVRMLGVYLDCHVSFTSAAFLSGAMRGKEYFLTWCLPLYTHISFSFHDQARVKALLSPFEEWRNGISEGGGYVSKDTNLVSDTVELYIQICLVSIHHLFLTAASTTLLHSLQPFF